MVVAPNPSTESSSFRQAWLTDMQKEYDETTDIKWIRNLFSKPQLVIFIFSL